VARPSGKLKLGCLGGLMFVIGIVLALYVLLAPWAFHIGGRWTPTTAWYGVGTMRDSTGARYGLYLSFYPDIETGRRANNAITGLAHPTPRTRLRGDAKVCTGQGSTFAFDVRGDMYGAWLDAEGHEMALGLTEPGTQRPRRHFQLVGAFHGADLAMDDDKSMFMYFLHDGTLTPARSYTSPVPEKHATVTLKWGTKADFDALCASRN
jgi:hypothetical protein